MSVADQCLPGSLGSDLRVATGRLQRSLRQQRGAADLPEGQFTTLAALHRHGPMTPGALADHERVRPPSMTKIVNQLVEQGLVAKTGSESDKRQVLVEITDAGSREVLETRRRRDTWLTARLETLDPAERQLLDESCKILLKLMET